jgi:WD repeat-containing protein 40A
MDFSGFKASRLPFTFQERQFSLMSVDKIFASQWLSESHLIIGTKCNRILIIDAKTGNIIGNIPTIKSISTETFLVDSLIQTSGIHSIAGKTGYILT